MKPAPELLGEVLVESARPREAIEPFGQTLRRHPNRSLSLLGLARAHAALGELDASRRRYRELLANFGEADRDLPELAEARHALAPPAAPVSRYVRAAVALAVVAAALAVIVRRRKRPRAPARPEPRKKKTRR